MDVFGQFAAHSKWCTVALITSSAFALGLGSAAAYWKRRGQHPPEEKIEEVQLLEEPVNQLTSTMAAAVENEQSAVAPCDLAASISQLSLSDSSVALASITPIERDSANHSPSDFLAGNIHSDTHSESSNDNDSGKGGSDCAANAHLEGGHFDVMTPPMSPAHGVNGCSSASSTSSQHMSHLLRHLAPLPERLFLYEFEIPQTLCGLLIGRYGAFVNHIRAKTGASLVIKKHPTNRRLKLCAIEGTKTEIDLALELLRDKFPLKRYPQVTLEQTNISTTPTAVPVLPDSIQLHLPAEVSCDVVVSSLVSPNHIFVQQVTHPTYPSLARLDLCMSMCYNDFETPLLPRPIQPSMVCAAPLLGGWYRAKVIAVHSAASSSSDKLESDKQQVDVEEVVVEGAELAEDPDQEVDICFVDYGGYDRVPASSLRQIRADFMSLPFQAVECLLANITPVDEEVGWSADACREMESMTAERMLQAQVVAYSLEGPPLVYLYQTSGSSDPAESEPVLVNRQLVTRGVAHWVEPQDLTPTE